MAFDMVYMKFPVTLRLAFLLLAMAVGYPQTSRGDEAATILEKSANRVQIDSFRVGLHVKTVRSGKRPYEYFLWLMGKYDQSATSIFVDFEEPKHTRGLRFLFRFHEKNGQNSSDGYMFLPATGGYVRLKPSNQSKGIGGTGLTMSDFRGFVPKKGDRSELVGQVALHGTPCYVVAVYSKDGGVSTKYWIAKDDFAVIKSITFDEGEKPIREFQVLEFFESKTGKRYPRRQEIVDKVDDTRIELVYEAGVYNVTLSEELFDPTKFGTIQWRTVPK